MTRMWIPVAVSVLACGMGSPPARGDALAEEVRSGNATSQAAVRTLQARVEATIRFDPKALPAFVGVDAVPKLHVMDYTRSGEKERITERKSPFRLRDVIRDYGSGKGTELMPNAGDRTIDQGMIADVDLLLPGIWPWRWALFRLPECNKPLHRLLVEGELAAARAKVEAGRKYVHLELRDAKGQYEAQVDPGLNYLVRKFIARRVTGGAKAQTDAEVLAFQELAPGVFFPTKVVHTISLNGKWFRKEEVTFSNVRLNQPIPEKTFQRKFPPGTSVYDAHRRVSWTVKADGQPTAPRPVIQPSAAPSKAGTPPDALPATSTPLTAEEGWPWHRFVLFGSAAALAVALGIVSWKRWKSPPAVPGLPSGE